MADIAPPLEETTSRALLPREGFIVSPALDLICFILSPLIGLAIIRSLVLGDVRWFISPQHILGVTETRIGFAIAVWTYAHLFAVVFRSHLNPAIFKLHRVRFTVVPLLVFLGFVTSSWALAIGLALSWFWDIYHSSMQVFGICRIYDGRLGNPPDEGRQLDIWMSHVVYVAPIFLGLGLPSTLESALRVFRPLGFDPTPTVIQPIVAAQSVIVTLILIVVPIYVAYYIASYRRMSRQGYRYSPQKAVMLFTTGAVSFFSWTVLHPIGALFVVNFFHALQYFAIVWWSENKNISRRFGLSRFAIGHLVALGLFFVIIFAEGTWVRVNATAHNAGVIAVSIATVISLMHFWYDGFIWSVRRHQV